MEDTELLVHFNKVFQRITKKDERYFDPNEEVSKLGIGSLTMLEIVSTMEEELGVSIPDECLVQIQTIRNLLDFFKEQTDGGVSKMAPS